MLAAQTLHVAVGFHVRSTLIHLSCLHCITLFLTNNNTLSQQQIGDTGSVVGPSGATLEVSDCQVAAGYVLHIGDAAGGVCWLMQGREMGTIKG